MHTRKNFINQLDVFFSLNAQYVTSESSSEVAASEDGKCSSDPGELTNHIHTLFQPLYVLALCAYVSVIFTSPE